MPDNTALYPGTFDCLTFGHLNLIERSSRLFGRVVVAVAVNGGKKPTFTLEERLEMLREETAHLPNVEITSFEGLTVHYAQKHDLQFIIRGLRAVSDFEYELQMALMNQRIAPDVETIFLTPSQDYVFVSSSLAKEIIANNGDASTIVPARVEKRVKEKIGMRAEG
jgi:pantetheine-phosphate adenylyltransferase